MVVAGSLSSWRRAVGMSASSPCITSWPPTAGELDLARRSATKRDCTRNGVTNDADHQPNTGESGRLSSADSADQCIGNCAPPRLSLHRCARKSTSDGSAAYCHVQGSWSPRLVRSNADGESVVRVTVAAPRRERRRTREKCLATAWADSPGNHLFSRRAGYAANRAAVGVRIKSTSLRERNAHPRRLRLEPSVSEGVREGRRIKPSEQIDPEHLAVTNVRPASLATQRFQGRKTPMT